MAISIVLADDHAMIRRGIRTLFTGKADFSVVGEACDGLDAIHLVERLKPNVLILDLMMPALSGLEVLRIVRRRSPSTRVVVLTMNCDNAVVGEALKNDAMGYVLKGSREEDLVHAVREAAAGRRFLSPPLNERDVEAYMEQSGSNSTDPHETLTPREREVLQLSAEGMSGPDIAERLHISPRTVETHRANLMRKLDLQNLSDLIRHALRHKLIAIEN